MGQGLSPGITKEQRLEMKELIKSAFAVPAGRGEAAGREINLKTKVDTLLPAQQWELAELQDQMFLKPLI